ncbi:hypothetical protein HYH02_015293 [Chlamydomonas schloesseri]|uniref:Glycosyl transferase CAP10 domain-containing protein n=1 Tax=Chlamydomonas schloesseri TaxID=2026947 RepID=A0A835SHT0_9CHLO|nr:hypothetical protein HYH02_015293 [Chlamydomonas schloesseri]|eukprot:KAG2423678.1 hypothetical protein HYH02_015293 [Chlamydomonas schloesseri]
MGDIRGGINETFVDAIRKRAKSGPGLYVAIRHGEVYVNLKRPGFQTRLYAALMLLHRAASRHHAALPDLELVIGCRDQPHPGAPFLAWCRPKADQLTWLYPDYSYYDWPEIEMPPYLAVHKRIAAVSAHVPFANRTNKFFWRGNLQLSGGLCKVRQALLDQLGNRTDIADVQSIPRIKDIRKNHSIAPAFTPLWDFCRHKYVVYTEGVSWSARLKFHLLCGSVLVSHPLSWDTLETLTMEEGKNVVTVKDREWSDVVQLHERLEGDPALAESIAAENRQYHHLLSGDGITCYILELLRCYSEAMTYTPSFNTSQLLHLEAFLLDKLNRRDAETTVQGGDEGDDEGGYGGGAYGGE